MIEGPGAKFGRHTVQSRRSEPSQLAYIMPNARAGDGGACSSRVGQDLPRYLGPAEARPVEGAPQGGRGAGIVTRELFAPREARTGVRFGDPGCTAVLRFRSASVVRRVRMLAGHDRLRAVVGQP